MIESSPPSRTGERRWRDDLHLAHTIADQVDPLTQAHFDNQDFEIETKPDLTPVTVADREAERLIRDYLSRARTRDSVLGEEFGTTGHSPRQWIIDPIDGTKNFVRGVPVWASLISLAEDGEVVVGLVSAPALGKRWWAVKGGGAWSGRSLALARQLHVSSVADLEDASLSYSSLSGWVDRRRLRGMLSLMQGCWRTRAYGDFWSYMLLASGGARARGLRHGRARPDRLRGRRALHLAGGRARPVGRRRRGHQWSAARRRSDPSCQGDRLRPSGASSEASKSRARVSGAE